MNRIAIQETNSEVHIIVFLDKQYPDKLSAMDEASKILKREVMYYAANSDKRIPW